jgi:hypothetical protein
MMDEETLEQMMSRAWLEGLEAAFDVDSPENPYEPVEYTPSLVEMNTVLLSKFTQLEIWRGEKQREGQLAEHERVMIVEELQQLRSVDVDPLVVQTINHCVGMIRRMTG